MERWEFFFQSSQALNVTQLLTSSFHVKYMDSTKILIVGGLSDLPGHTTFGLV
jgi:hypothetical protein